MSNIGGPIPHIFFDNPVAKCICNNSRRGWLSSTSVSALRRGRWPLPTGFGLVPNHRHVNTTLTGGIYRMVQSNSSARWAFEIPSSVVRNRSIARVRHRTHRVLYSSMVAALANFYLVTAFFGLRAKRPRVINTVWLVLPIVVGMGNTTHNSPTARPWYGQVDTR